MEGKNPSQLDAATAIALKKIIETNCGFEIAELILFLDPYDSYAPKLKALNSDDENYLSGLTFTRIDVGHYEVSSANDKFLPGLTQIFYTNHIGSGSTFVINTTRKIISIYTHLNNILSDDILFFMPLTVKVKKRGDPISIISAVTNIAGDQIIVTVDKDLEGGCMGAWTCFTLSGGKGLTAINKTNNKEFTLNVDSPYSNGDNISFDYDESASLEPLMFVLESIEHGIIEPVTGVNVTNNVPF